MRGRVCCSCGHVFLYDPDNWEDFPSNCEGCGIKLRKPRLVCRVCGKRTTRKWGMHEHCFIEYLDDALQAENPIHSDCVYPRAEEDEEGERELSAYERALESRR